MNPISDPHVQRFNFAGFTWPRYVATLTPLSGLRKKREGRRVTARTGDKVRCVDRYNEPQTWDSTIGLIRYFVEWIDDARVAELQDNYSRIEVIE